ncbi:translocase of chloroplast 159, chloroplastic [Ricinus communis]|uniref:GTP binding protein, putative n=1 Tax=Ricinus communis TaxID=3988 RepID=B9RT53_RICCO|nr:translocase of chloroplast 159, chloroplastic [Ricinus communis]EEF45536.1 GTP binding protein, putative [Ricinus communis]|eukprot:XP_002516922.1 translocase of chloroplast 159, chloroplastic [Ricinus communis]
MASNPHVSLSTTRAGSFPIRAPVTLDDSSDFESDGHDKTDNSDTTSIIYNGSESEEYVSGEEFESASEKLFIADTDEENHEQIGFFYEVTNFRPLVANADEESLGISVDDEESGVTEEYDPIVDSDIPSSPKVMPIAQLSMDDDEFEELMCVEGMVRSELEDNSFSGIVKVPSIGLLDRIDSAPRVRVSDIQKDKEAVLFLQEDSSVMNDSQLLALRDNEDLLGKLVGADIGVLSSENDKLAVKDGCHVILTEAYVRPLLENKVVLEENSEMNEDVTHDMDDSVSVELVDKYGHFVPEAHVDSLVDSSVLEKNLKLDDDPRHFVEEKLPCENSQQEKIALNGGDWGNEKSMGNDFVNHAFEQCGTSVQKEQIGEVANVCDDPHGSELDQVGNILLELEEMKVDGIVLLKEQITKMVNSSNNQKMLLEPQILKVEAADFNNKDKSVSLEKDSDTEKLEDKTGQETSTVYQSLGPEDVIPVVSVDTAFEMNEIQTVDLLGNGDMPEMFESDILELQSNAKSFGILDEKKTDSEKIEMEKSLLSNEEIEDLNKHIINELKTSFFSSHQAAEDFHNDLQKIDEQAVPEADQELETDEKREEKKLFNPATLPALLNAAARAELVKSAATSELDRGRNRVTAADGSRVFSLKHPAGSNSSFDTKAHASQSDMAKDAVNDDVSQEERKIFEKLQHIRVKFLRLVHRLGLSPEDSTVVQVLHRLVLAAGLHVRHKFCNEFAKRMAMQLEAEGKDDLDFCLNILVIGKTGVGKSATVNSIFGEKKVMIDAFDPATTKVKEIFGTIDGVRIRILDTPGLRTSVKEEATNRKILESIKKLTKQFPPDVVLYVDRLDTHRGDLNDLSLLASISNILTASIWRNAIVTLTHAAAPPPEESSGSPLSFEMFVAQRSHVIQQAISQAVGDPHLMHPSMMHPVSLVENHPSCQKDGRGESVLPNGQIWRSQLLLLCYALKILSEASPKTKPRNQFQKLPLPNFLTYLLQSRPHSKLTAKQDGDDIDSGVELLALSDSDGDDYDQLPLFNPLKKSQVDKLSEEQRKAYIKEYDYRVKLLQKKQWKEEVKRLKELKKKGKDHKTYHGYSEEAVDQENGGPATVEVPMPDFFIPPSFDSDSPSYRYRMLKHTSQLLVRPILESHGWDHDIGYDGIGLERNLVIADQFPGAFAVQITKNKQEFNFHLDSSICAKHAENGSTMAGFDIQAMGKQLAYILRSETKFKNFKLHKTTCGMSITLLGKNISTGLKIEDQIAVGKRLALVGSAGAVRSGSDAAYGANFEVPVKGRVFPPEQDQSTLDLSLMKWRGELGLMANIQSQFSIGRNSKMAIQVGMNNKQTGQIIIKTNSSELQVALISTLPMLISMLRSVCPGGEVRKIQR